jgi:hypothetical protein
MLVASGSYQRLYGDLTTRERGRGQFLQARQAEALQEQFRCREAQAAVCTGKFLHKLEISERHDEPALVGIEETVDFRLADRLPKGDAGEHFERGGRETRNPVLSAFCRPWLMGKKATSAAGGFRPMSEVVRNRRACSGPLLPSSYAQEASARHAGWHRAH